MNRKYRKYRLNGKQRFFVLMTFLIGLALCLPFLTTSGSAAVEPAPIRLQAAAFNPGRGEAPVLPPGLAIAADASNAQGYWYYIVQFAGPVQAEWKQRLADMGAEVLEYIPDFAFKVRMNPGLAQRASRLDFVSYVGYFEPAYKLSPGLARSGPNLYSLRIERGAAAQAAVEAINAAGAQVVSREGDALIVAADAAQLEALANVLDVAWIENFQMPETHNEYGGGQIIGASAANANGYDGSTQTIAIADTGLGGGTAATAHADLAAGRIAAIYNRPGENNTCWTITDDGAVDVNLGHGTHVALSALGAGGAGGVGKGTAPAAQLVFQSIENWATMIGTCAQTYSSGYYLVGTSGDLRPLFQQAYDAGARIHANSWGSAVNGDYTANSVYADDFIWNHPDMLITFSAGNSGKDANADGVVDNGSLGAPATAKNVLAVGASENNRQGNWQCDTTLGYTGCAASGGQNSIFTWGSGWPSSYPANPLYSDPSAGNAQQMAAFSSRGPTQDGRIKPDVVAPGSWVLSGYSDLYQQGYDASPNPQNGAWQYDGYGYPYNQSYKYMSGTSMSNPIVAGGAAVVRDFYQKAHGLQASAALVKASLINSASDLLDENNDGANDNDFPIPNMHEGWGLVNLVNATDGTAQFVDHTGGLGSGANALYEYSIGSPGVPLKVTLVWSDYPSTEAAAVNLVNDLNLTVLSPSGAVYAGNVFSGGWSQTGGAYDRVNNVENVYVQAAESGVWTVRVDGYNVPSGLQPFALVVDGGFGLPQPTPTPGPTSTPMPAQPQDTGYLSAAAGAPVMKNAGDNNGFQLNSYNALVSDNLYAADPNSGSRASLDCNSPRRDKHKYYNFNFNIPASASVLGIEVQVEARADSSANSPMMCVSLSWDGGATWSAPQLTGILGAADVVYTLGGPNYLWNRTWAPVELGNGAFQMRITNVADSTARSFYLDWLAVKVTYMP